MWQRKMNWINCRVACLSCLKSTCGWVKCCSLPIFAMLADSIQTAMTNGVPMLWSVSSTVVIIVSFFNRDGFGSRSAIWFGSGSLRTMEKLFDKLGSPGSNWNEKNKIKSDDIRWCICKKVWWNVCESVWVDGPSSFIVSEYLFSRTCILLDFILSPFHCIKLHKLDLMSWLKCFASPLSFVVD